MGRVLQIGALILGGALLVITGSLWAERSHNGSFSTIVILVENDRQEHYFALIELQSHKIFRLTPNYVTIDRVGQSANGQWLYFVEYAFEDMGGDGETYGRLRRVELTPHAPRDELLERGVSPFDVTWTADREWLVTGNQLENQLVAINSISGARRILTSGLPTNLWFMAWPTPFISGDGEWVLFRVHDADYNYLFYRARLDGTQLEYLDQADGLDLPHYQGDHRPQNALWYINEQNTTLFRIRNNFREAHLITPPKYIYRPHNGPQWLSKDIVLLDGESGWTKYALYALRLDDGAVLWEFNGVWDHTILDNGNWVALARYNDLRNSLYITLIRKDGSEQHITPISFSDLDEVCVIGWSPDKQWLVYTHYDSATRQYGLYRLSTDWQTIEPLLQNQSHRIDVMGWQGNKLILGLFSTNRDRYAVGLYQLDWHSRELSLMLPPLFDGYIVEINGPQIDHHLRPANLLLMGSTLLGSSLGWGIVLHKKEGDSRIAPTM